MPLDWLEIGLNSAEKITLLSLRIILESQYGNPILPLQIATTYWLRRDAVLGHSHHIVKVVIDATC